MRFLCLQDHKSMMIVKGTFKDNREIHGRHFFVQLKW